MPGPRLPTGARRVLLAFGLIYLSLYPPLAALVYLPGWYRINCDWHPRCEMLGAERSERAIVELTRYWRHQGELGAGWSGKERQHLAEVRPIYDALFVGVFLAAGALLLGWERRYVTRTALWVAAGIAALALVLPFFGYFWTKIFHGLLFDNTLWKNTPRDVSWYIMPRQLFMYSVGVMIACAASLSLAVAWWTRTPRSDPTQSRPRP